MSATKSMHTHTHIENFLATFVTMDNYDVETKTLAWKSVF